MIADAHTNPFVWRQCPHPVFTENRCTACGAIRHPEPYHQIKHSLSSSNPARGVPLAYVMSVADEKLLAATGKPCKKGHRDWYVGTDGKIDHCRQCVRERDHA